MACFYNGFVYECGVSAPLTIDGLPVSLRNAKKDLRSRATRLSPAQIRKFARRRIDALARAHRDPHRAAHLKELRKGVDSWNRWRRRHPTVHPVLSRANLRREFDRGTIKKLDGIDFSYANLTQANLRGLHLRGASFHQAVLAKANLSDAHVEGANFCRTDLYETNFKRAHFRGANLQGVQLTKTDLRGAHLRGCNLYGLSAWDLQLDGETQQRGLRITYEPLGSTAAATPEVAIVDGLDLAAFIYMTLNNRNISRVFDATTRKWVLLLGRFARHRQVLERLKEELKERKKYVPIIFDFSQPERQDLIETVTLLAGMSAFVIVDISDPRSTPMELQAIAPHYGVPIVPIKRRQSREFATFSALAKFPWVLPTVPYRSIADLVRKLDGSVIRPALARGRLLGRRNER